MKRKSNSKVRKTTSKSLSGYSAIYWMRFLVFSLVIALAVGIILSYFTIKNSMAFCANSISCINNMQVAVDNTHQAYFEGNWITPPKIDLAMDPTPSRVLGETTGDKHIYVDLSTQKLYAFQGTTSILETYIASGKWNPTPPGDYHIWVKLRSTRMSGGSGADAYDLPNVPYVMFFYNDKVSKADGFSLHGAYWHDNFGHPMSHGCVNMRTVDAKTIYDWADPITQSTTTYTTPTNQGTIVSICKTIEFQPGQAPACVE